MNKLMKLVVVASFVVSLALFSVINPTKAATTTHKVQFGDTYWKISQKYGVSLDHLMGVNKATNSILYAGATLVIPTSIPEADKDLMARLVHAEAKGESYAGKVAVATVILNRIDSPLFPNTVKGVIYQIDGGHYAFTPVQNGTINQPADQEAKRAVNEALMYRGQGNGSLYFYNPKTSTSRWILSREVTVTIGNHRFSK